jgi:hypothetical protein
MYSLGSPVTRLRIQEVRTAILGRLSGYGDAVDISEARREHACE